ncbi:hypothetical protein BN132_3908 [Cronobacter turicensis 564]|nr:hypothetical protein BN132_3908 [Cronobacter turicensis 564]
MKPRSKLKRTAQCIVIKSRIQVAKMAKNSLPVMPGRQNLMKHSFYAVR